MSDTQLDILSTLKQRGERYGSFTGHAEVTQQLKTVLSVELMKRHKALPLDQQEALEMIFHKIGRIVNGDNNYDDSWVDISGYAQLIVTKLQGKPL